MKIKVFRENEDVKIPTKAHPEDAGWDIYTPVDCVAYAHKSVVIDTKVHINIPKGYCGILKSKSGLNVKHGLTGTGTIDAGYTGSICVKLLNNSDENYFFKKGDKIIQMVILPIPETEMEEVYSLDVFDKINDRGENGFGSSGR